MDNKKLLKTSAFLLILGITACKKDLDFKKFNDLKLKPEFGLPLADFKLKITDAISQGDLIKYDPDGFIRLVYADDSLAYFPADSLVSIPSIVPESFFTRLGAVDVGNINVINSRTLSNIADGFNNTTKAALNSAAGNVTIFPAINDQNNTLVVLPNQTNADFVDVTMSQGFLKIEMQNRLPVTMDQVVINLFNLIPFQTLLGQVVLSNIPPNQSKADSINLAGKSLSTSIGYTMPVFKTFASSSPVLVNLNDSITVFATSSKLKAIAGNAVFPNQDINPKDIIVKVVAEDTTVRIKKAVFEEAFINYTVTSTVKEKIDLTIKIPGAKKNGLPLAPIVISVNNNTVTGKIDIANNDLDLGLIPSMPYNNLKVLVEPKIVSSNQIKPFDSSDFIDANFTFSKFVYKDLEGYLGSKILNINPTQIKIEVFRNLNSGLRLEDTKLRVKSQNSIGIPINVNVDATAINSKRSVNQDLNGPDFTIAYPSLAQKGQTINGTFEYNKNNSSIVDFIAIAPDKISFEGKCYVNKNGFNNNYSDFIQNTNAINVGFELEAPFNLRSDNISLQDTIQYPFMDVENNNFKDSSVFGITFDKLDFLEVLTKIDNSFPFNGGFTLYFADENYQVKDSIVGVQLFESAIPDANGKTQTRKVTQSGFRLTSEQFRNHFNNKLINTIVSVKLNTYNNGTVPVKLYTDYETRIGLSGKVKAMISTKNK